MFKKSAVSRLEIIYQELINSTPPAPQDEGLMARVGVGVNAKTQSICQCVAYIWGGVGREKLADGPFYQSLPRAEQRLHFHRFMLQVHDELTEL